MARLYFDVWPSDDMNGTALGELTQAYGKSVRVVYQAIGSGQFTINRHDSQYVAGWCAQDNLVRVRTVSGGPFAFDDSRYVGAFLIEEGADVLLSPDEEGGDEITRGGRDPIVLLRRAVLNYEADFAGDDVYAASALVDGQWHFRNKNAGTVLRVALRNATARTPDPLDPTTHDFSTTTDTAGDDWSDSDADWSLPVGMDYLSLLDTLASGDLWWRMGLDLVLHAWDADPGADVSGSVVFTKGANIREAAERAVHAREAISRALVQGTLESGKLKFRWVTSGSTETQLGGRREGFVEYQATPTNTRLDRAGGRAIRQLRQQWEGPTTLGVIDTPGAVAFTDYQPGDTVSVDIPGEFESLAVKVFAIILEEREAGDYDVSLELEQSPFDPLANLSGSATEGPSSGTKCGDCPPIPPYVPTPIPGTPTSTTGGVLYKPRSLTAPDFNIEFENNGDNPPPGYTSRPLDTAVLDYVAGTVWQDKGFVVVADGATLTFHAKMDSAGVYGAGTVHWELNILLNGAVIATDYSDVTFGGLTYHAPVLECTATDIAVSAGDVITCRPYRW